MGSDWPVMSAILHFDERSPETVPACPKTSKVKIGGRPSAPYSHLFLPRRESPRQFGGIAH
jgi:hypothetical protein